MTMKKIILHYLKLKIANGDYTIRNSEMVKIMNFGHKNFGRMHSVGTYERRFRELKNEPEKLKSVGITGFVDVTSKYSTAQGEKVLKMRTDNELQL